MSTPQSNIHFWKIDDKTCKIECSLAGAHSQVNTYMSPEEMASTVLVMLCELIEISKINSKLLKLLENELNITEENKIQKREYVSNYFIPLNIAMKYIEKCTQIEVFEELLFFDTVELLNLNPEIEDALWADIFQNAEHKFYRPTKEDIEQLCGEDEKDQVEVWLNKRHLYWGNMNFLQHWELLEKHLSIEQIYQIYPRQVFKLTFKEDYLSDIEDLESHQSCLDAHICSWLDKKRIS